MKKQMRGFVVLLLMPFVSVQAESVKLSGVFADNMVLQRDKPVAIWGWATPGEAVTVSFSDQSKTTVADTVGKWTVKLDPLSASDEPRELRVKSAIGNRQVEVKNVLVGDVFLLGGQSNMTWWLSTSKGGEEAVKRANYPWLRVFEVGYQIPEQPAADVANGANWKMCTPETAGKISGVGFFFAEAIHPHTKVPIALLQTAEPGTWGENWLSRAAMEADPEFRYSLEPYEKALQELPEKQKEWEREKAKHNQAVAEAKAAGKEPPAASRFVQLGPIGPAHPHRPNALYNGRIAPLMPFALRGILWYQGEGNCQINLAEHYHKLLRTLVCSWREGFCQGELPFFIVQLPRFEFDSPWCSMVQVREAQLRVSQELPNCGLVTLMDEGEGTDIHPKNKLPVGERLARLARAMIFNEPLVPTGPLLVRHEIRDGAVWLHFSNVGAGLRSGDGALRGFTVCGEDKVFHPAQAEIISQDSLRVTCAAVLHPVAARYAWAHFPDCNLCNSEGLPASPVRTDDFDVGLYPPRKP